MIFQLKWNSNPVRKDAKHEGTIKTVRVIRSLYYKNMTSAYFLDVRTKPGELQRSYYAGIRLNRVRPKEILLQCRIKAKKSNVEYQTFSKNARKKKAEVNFAANFGLQCFSNYKTLCRNMKIEWKTPHYILLVVKTSHKNAFCVTDQRYERHSSMPSLKHKLWHTNLHK